MYLLNPLNNNWYSIKEKKSNSNDRHQTRKGDSSKKNTIQGGLGSESTDLNQVSIVFVTASSANHMLTLQLDHLPSIEKWVLNAPVPTFLPTLEGESAPTKDDLSVRVIHYNLDPVEKRSSKKNQANIEDLRHKFPFVELREFNYSAYPSYFNIEIAKGEYAFKPVIVDQVARELQELQRNGANNSTFDTRSKKNILSLIYIIWMQV